jgi:hypothetical protein
VPVYGAAQDVHKAEFLSELVRTCESETLPMLVGVTSTLFATEKKKIMITSKRVGLLFLMQLLSI